MRYRQAEIEMISKCIGVVLDHFRHLVTLATCGISCARSYRSVRNGAFWGGAVPGTSCRPTTMLSLRDERVRSAEALIKLALTG